MNYRGKLDCLKIKELYNKYNSLSLVAKELNCHKDTIRYVMLRTGIKINSPIVYSCNHNFFVEENEKSFYWAGFIAADGCIKHNNSQLYIGLSFNDIEHLNKFKNDIKAENPIHTYIVKNSKRNISHNDTFKCEIKISSKEICKSLFKFNIVERKTLIYEFPEQIINNEYLHHFMRGYFDGDGSWYHISSKKRSQMCFNLRGTKKFLLKYREVLENNCNIKKREKDIRINNNIGVLEYGGNAISAKIANFLYKNSNIYLNRKYEKIKNYLT